MAIIGFTGTGTTNTSLAALNISKMNVATAAVLEANQQLGLLRIRCSASNDIETTSIQVSIYDVSSGVNGATKLLTKTITLPSTTTEQWVAFGPYTDDLSAHAGKTLVIVLGTPDAAYAIRSNTGVTGDGSNESAGVNLPATWTKTANSSSQFCMYFETSTIPAATMKKIKLTGTTAVISTTGATSAALAATTFANAVLYSKFPLFGDGETAPTVDAEFGSVTLGADGTLTLTEADCIAGSLELLTPGSSSKCLALFDTDTATGSYVLIPDITIVEE